MPLAEARQVRANCAEPSTSFLAGNGLSAAYQSRAAAAALPESATCSLGGPLIADRS